MFSPEVASYNASGLFGSIVAFSLSSPLQALLNCGSLHSGSELKVLIVHCMYVLCIVCILKPKLVCCLQFHCVSLFCFLNILPMK